MCSGIVVVETKSITMDGIILFRPNNKNSVLCVTPDYAVYRDGRLPIGNITIKCSVQSKREIRNYSYHWQNVARSNMHGLITGARKTNRRADCTVIKHEQPKYAPIEIELYFCFFSLKIYIYIYLYIAIIRSLIMLREF